MATTEAPEIKVPADVAEQARVQAVDEFTKQGGKVTTGPTKVARGAKSKQRKTLRLTSRAKSPKTAKPANGTAKTTKVKLPRDKTASTPARAKGDFTNDQKITLVKKPDAGDLAARYALMKSGTTVGQALAACKGLPRRRATLRKLIEGKFVSVR